MNVFFKKKNKTEKDEGRSGKYIEDTRTPRVDKKDLNNGLVQVVILIPGLEPSDDKVHPKNGRVKFDFLNNGFGFAMKTVVVDNKNNLRTTYKLQIKRFPGRIDMADSKWDVEKGKIVVMMEKHSDSRNIDWTPALTARGLDQLSSSSSSSDDD